LRPAANGKNRCRASFRAFFALLRFENPAESRVTC
jgi:hypothetical protein